MVSGGSTSRLAFGAGIAFITQGPTCFVAARPHVSPLPSVWIAPICWHVPTSLFDLVAVWYRRERGYGGIGVGIEVRWAGPGSPLDDLAWLVGGLLDAGGQLAAAEPQLGESLAGVGLRGARAVELLGGHVNRLLSIFNRVYGVKPGRDAPPLERALWFRGYHLRNLALAAPACVLVLAFLPAWVLLIVLLPTLLGFIRLTAEIRRERKRRESP